MAVKMTTNEPLFPYKARFRAFLRTNLKNRVRRKKCCTKCTSYADDKIMRKTVELQSFTVQRTGVQTVRMILQKFVFSRTGVDKGFDAQKSAYPAATGQINVVGWFKVQTGGIFSCRNRWINVRC